MMKRLRYILPFVLSLLIIYIGVGVSICSCMMCERSCVACATPCESCHDSEESTTEDCEDGTCSVSIFKVNLAQQSEYTSPISVPSFDLFCGLLPDFQATLFRSAEAEVPYMVPPNADGSRHYLALYSVLLI